MTETALLCLLLYGFILTAHGLQYQRVRPNGMAVLSCSNAKEGEVTWSRYINGSQLSIVSTDNGETIRHMKNNNHSLLPNRSLIIWFVIPQDNGLYYCNGAPEACLMVKAADGQSTEDWTTCLTDVLSVNVTQRVLMFGGVSLAALMFLVATVAAVKVKYATGLVCVRSTSESSNDFQLS